MGYEQLRIVDADDESARTEKERILAGLVRLGAGLDAHFAEGSSPPRRV